MICIILHLEQLVKREKKARLINIIYEFHKCPFFFLQNGGWTKEPMLITVKCAAFLNKANWIVKESDMVSFLFFAELLCSVKLVRSITNLNEIISNNVACLEAR